MLRKNVRTDADDHEKRLRTVAERWSATSRELDVLRWLVQGDSNKEIAVRLDCSEVTVERRVTALLRKARCDTRNRLLASFWSGRSFR
jgi:DNA-binding CsgD family transcriptional regulator